MIIDLGFPKVNMMLMHFCSEHIRLSDGRLSVNIILLYHRARADGTFDIDYEDGEFEMKVPEDLIRVKEGAASSSGSRKKALEEGDKVEGNYKGKGKWYPGVIKR